MMHYLKSIMMISCIFVVAACSNGADPAPEDNTPRTTDEATTENQDDLLEQSDISVRFKQTEYSVAESDQYIDLVIERVGDVSQSLTVNVDTSEGDAISGQDFEGISSQLVWNANDQENKTIRINLLADIDIENEETLYVTLSNPTAGIVGEGQTVSIHINDSDCNEELAGTISEDQHLDQYCYHVTQTVYVENSALSIAPGVTLVFDEGTMLNIRESGSLQAIGLENQRITLTGREKTRGSWIGLQFTWSFNDINELDYVTIEYGGGNGGNGNANLTLYGTRGLPQKLKANHLTLRESATYGFDFSNDAELTEFNHILSTDNTSGPGRLPSYLLSILNKDSQFSGNDIDRMVGRGTYVEVDQLWRKLDVPYYFPQVQYIRAHLTIEEGCTLLFGENTYLNIQQEGSLTAVGSASQPISFTAESPVPGFWGGIQFTFSDSELNEIRHAVIEYGGQNQNGTANLVMYGGYGLPQRLKLTDVELRNGSGYGFEFNIGTDLVEFRNITSSGNRLGPGALPATQLEMLAGNNSAYSGNDVDLMVVQREEIKTPVTWPKIDVDYDISGGVSVAALLTIEAGSTFYFRKDTYINAESTGSIQALGTSDEPVTFTGFEQSPGYWRGIQLTHSTVEKNKVENLFDYVVFEYAGGAGGNGTGGLVLFASAIDHTKAIVSNSVFKDNLTNDIDVSSYGVLVESNNTFLGGGIHYQ